jgi:hypothetical protein
LINNLAAPPVLPTVGATTTALRGHAERFQDSPRERTNQCKMINAKCKVQNEGLKLLQLLGIFTFALCILHCSPSLPA